MLKFLDSLALITLCAAIFGLSSQSSLPIPLVFDFQDKLHHFIAYFVMGILAWRCFRHFVPPSLLVVTSIAFCSIHGISDEWHQSFVPGRSSDVLDWVADTIGATVSMLLLPQLKRVLKITSI
ncbi:VanZ family protein [Methyloglobulus morosus KoM1]|uniref:VanZ family protein n=2 Tax=Methyloglobulus TaxID=1410680 RepID=V5BL07_9GAMM|nr:VanZ family protein [Methyloglobulus morosus]ESS68469.1 VanZ family protein [Methyloglobulus morosus KoM1]